MILASQTAAGIGLTTKQRQRLRNVSGEPDGSRNEVGNKEETEVARFVLGLLKFEKN